MLEPKLRLVLLILLGPLAPVAAAGQDPLETEPLPEREEIAGPDSTDSARTRAGSPGPVVDLQLFTSGVFDSNIDNDADAQNAFGVIAGGTVALRERTPRPRFTAAYTLLGHSYTNTDRWDRVGHDMRAALVQRWNGGRLELGGRASLQGTTVDRELADQYSALTRVDVRLARFFWFQGSGAYRRKHYEDTNSDADAPYVGAELRYGSLRRGRWEAGIQQDWNDAESPLRSWRRTTYRMEYRTPVATWARLRLAGYHRRQRYTERFVTVDGAPVPRRDRRWTAVAAWDFFLGRRWQVDLDYAFDTRDSNEPARDFDGHRVGLTTRFRW